MTDLRGLRRHIRRTERILIAAAVVCALLALALGFCARFANAAPIRIPGLGFWLDVEATPNGCTIVGHNGGGAWITGRDRNEPMVHDLTFDCNSVEVTIRYTARNNSFPYPLDIDDVEVLSVSEGFIAVPYAQEVDEGDDFLIRIVPNEIG